MRSMTRFLRRKSRSKSQPVTRQPALVEPMEVRQFLSGTVSFVDVPIDSAAKAADPTLSSLRTMDVKLTISSGDDWLASDLLLNLTTGSFYNPKSGGNVPQTGDWPDEPQLKFDTWVGGPNLSAPTILGRQSGSGAAIFSPSQISVAFGDLQNLGAGTFTLARLTMTNDATGSLTGSFYTLAAPSTKVPFSKNITAIAPPPTTIKGWVFNDLNADGAQTTGENRLASWQVYIDANNNGKLDSTEKSVKTNSSGNFTFGELAPGTYRVRLTLKSGFRRTAPSAGSFNVGLTSGLTADRKVFGVTQRARISGLVFNDANGDKSKGSGEAGLSGWRVYIDRDNDGKFDSNETSVRSASDGSWKFDNLGAGTYVVRIVQVSGYTRTTPTSGVFSLAASNGSDLSGNNFGQKAV